jgi:hypothetical protein
MMKISHSVRIPKLLILCLVYAGKVLMVDLKEKS